MNTQTKYIEANKTSKKIYTILLITYFLCAFIFSSKGISEGVGLWCFYVAGAIMWAAAIHTLQIAIGIFKDGSFPASNATLPVRTRQYQGVVAKLIFILSLLAFISLLVMPILWKYENDLIMKEIESVEKLGIDIGR